MRVSVRVYACLCLCKSEVKVSVRDRDSSQMESGCDGRSEVQDWRILYFETAYAPPPPLSPFLFLTSYLSQVHDRRLFEFKRWLHKLYTVSRATTADALAVGRVGKPGH